MDTELRFIEIKRQSMSEILKKSMMLFVQGMRSLPTRRRCVINFVPKFEYDPGTGPVTVTMTLPPEKDNLNERETADIDRTFSNNGTAQHQFNYIEQTIEPRFVFVEQSTIDELRTMFETHALQGKEFKYFEHSDEASFITVTLDSFEFRPKRIIPDGSGGFIHDIAIRMRRTI